VLAVEDDLVAVDKPAGLPVVPARDEAADRCLRARLEAELGYRLWVVHRLDRDTSGVVLFARDAATHRALSLAFERREVAKTYVAFVAGPAQPERGRIDLPLHAARRGKARPARPGEPGAQAAATGWRVVRRWSTGAGDRLEIARLELAPESGRHHQLRVHLRSLGAPILFDRLYGKGAITASPDAPCSRLALHALRLTLPPDPGGRSRAFEAPLAADLVALERWFDALGEFPAPVEGAAEGLHGRG
jgi:tRNA pseudouridine32 synthase/23S rRNA pseudouridine746 synthase